MQEGGDSAGGPGELGRPPGQMGQVAAADHAPVVVQASRWGSIIPAAWSFMLAARARGLGTVWTTFHLRHEREAAELLGLPFDTVMQAALIPVAHTIGTDFKPAARHPPGHHGPLGPLGGVKWQGMGRSA